MPIIYTLSKKRIIITKGFQHLYTDIFEPSILHSLATTTNLPTRKSVYTEILAAFIYIIIII